MSDKYSTSGSGILYTTYCTIQDLFFVEMSSGSIQDRLLEEDASTFGVTYSNLVEIANNQRSSNE
ncbi:hypothetical protein QTP88_006119 [Uroleucon formosanum]